MIWILSRVPENLQKPIAFGLCWVAFILALFGVAGLADFTETTKTSGYLAWKETTARTMGERMPSLLGGLAAIAVAILCIAAALVLITAHGRLKKYPAILTGVETIKIQQIAAITKSRPSRVYQDIQTLIDAGIVNDFYIDYGAEQVVSKRYIPKRSHKTVVSCSGCGGNNEVIVGITRNCAFCGEPLVLKAT